MDSSGKKARSKAKSKLLGFLCFSEVEFAWNHYENGQISNGLKWLELFELAGMLGPLQGITNPCNIED